MYFLHFLNLINNFLFFITIKNKKNEIIDIYFNFQLFTILDNLLGS